MDKMPIFTWKAPNIHVRKGAEWIARHRVYIPQPDPDKWERAFGPWEEGGLAAEGCKPATADKPPSSVGDGFYKALRKLGYQREGTLGDYR